jgi:HlyD family secretion protein
MAGRIHGRPGRWVGLWLSAAPALVAGAWLLAADREKTGDRPPVNEIEWVEVRRADLDTTLVAGGDLQPTKETTVTCRVEDITDADGTMIVSLVENGASVKKGEELCRLDSSELEELARQQEILVDQARSACVRARLMLEMARIALREYQEGLVVQQTKEFEGRIALGRSDTQRLRDHLNWTERMVAKGYASQAQLISERQALAQAQHDLRKAEGEFELFRRFQVNKEIVALRGEIGIAEHNHQVEAARFKAEEEELAYIRKQIDHCIVRAPQDGIAIYSRKGFWRWSPLQAGVRVYENQELFKLPDHSRMEVEVSVNESMGPRVKVGMRAEIQIASLGERRLPGRVSSITPLSSENDKEWDERVRHFIARVRLDATPPRLLPLMSAVVESDTGRVRDTLVIPIGAMTVRDRQQCCYVVGPSGLERRPISTRHATRDLLEVIAGVKEGERVVLQPPVEFKT